MGPSDLPGAHPAKKINPSPNTGVVQVNDGMSVDFSEPEAVYYTVVSGDTLSKISKVNYGDANKYMVIFEANKPMLTHPDKIYPGQALRIPAEA